MSKQKFVGEYPINASRKMLFPYLSTASGLCEWFADDVNINNINKKTISLKPGPFVDMWDVFNKEAGFQIANQ